MRMYLGLLMLGVLFSCADGKRKEIEQISDEVIVLHDKVMPLMDALYKTRMQLQKITKTDSMAFINLNGSDVIIEIKSAEDAMMNWMRNFDPGFEGANDDETIQYLMDQKKAIEQVTDEMNGAMEKGKVLLNRK